MKRILLLAALLPVFASAAPYDVYVDQRNPGNTATITRTMTPIVGSNGMLGYLGSTNLPYVWRLGNSFMYVGNTIETASDWVNVTSKPNFALVATSGAYGDLSGRPVIPAAQVNSDWTATGTVAEILNKPLLAPVATLGTYASLTGIPSAFAPAAHTQAFSTITSTPTTLAGYGITDGLTASALAPYATSADLTTGLATKFNNPAGTVAQYLRGDGTAATFPTAVSAFANDSAYVSQAGARSAISLTTTGTGGAATYNSATGVLNVPTYANSGGTVTSVTAGTGLSGGTFTTTGTISMPNVGTAGTYANVTTDAQGRVVSGTNLSINDAPGRALVTATNATGFQISATRTAQVCYEGSFSTTSTIGGPSSATVFLETADTNSVTPTDWTIKAQQTYSNNITLAIVLNQVQGNNWTICRYIPAGKYVRIRAGAISGTASASINTNQQEVLQ